MCVIDLRFRGMAIDRQRPVSGNVLGPVDCADSGIQILGRSGREATQRHQYAAGKTRPETDSIRHLHPAFKGNARAT